MTKTTNKEIAKEDSDAVVLNWMRQIEVNAHGKTEKVLISSIKVDPRFQVREAVDDAYIARLADLYAEHPDRVRPVDLVRIKKTLYLVAGFQRLKAAKAKKLKEINAIVVEGDEKTAYFLALGSNNHGLPMSKGDKAKAIGIALEQFYTFSNGMIGKLVGCDESYVRQIKKKLEVRTAPNQPEKVLGKDGKQQARYKKTVKAPAKSVAKSDVPTEEPPIVETVEVESSTIAPAEATEQVDELMDERTEMERLADRLADHALNPSSGTPEAAMAKMVKRMRNKLPEENQKGFEVRLATKFRHVKPNAAKDEVPPVVQYSTIDLKAAFPSIIKELQSDDKERTPLFQMFVNTMLNDGFSDNAERMEFVNWIRGRVAQYPVLS